MKRMLSRVLLMAVVGAAVGVFGVGQAAQAVVNCPPNILNTTVNDSVTVPVGQTCTIQNSTINGNVDVKAGANLIIIGSTIHKNPSTGVGGNVTLKDSASLRIDALGPCTVAGDPTSCVRRTIIEDSVKSTNTTSVPAGFAANYICNGTIITNDLKIEKGGPAAPWVIGDPATCSFGGNTIGGDVQIKENRANVSFRNNLVSKDLKAEKNTGGGSIVGNTIGKDLLVENTAPCWFVSGNAVSGKSEVIC